MSTCLIYQSKNNMAMGADTAISVNGKRVYGDYKKITNICGQLVFVGGLKIFSELINDYIEDKTPIDLIELRNLCLKNYGTSDYYYDEDGNRIVCKVAISRRELDGIVHTYILSSTNGFKIEDLYIENEGECEVLSIGLNDEELLNSYKKYSNKFINQDGNIQIDKVFRKAFEEIITEEIGGHLDLYILKPVEYNFRATQVIYNRYILEDKYKATIFDFVSNEVKKLFLGTEEIDGVTKTRLRLMSEDGQELLISEDGLCLKDQVNFVDNVSPSYPIVIPYRVDEGIREVRKCILTLYLQKYRAYERSAKSNQMQTSSEGGGFNIVTGGGNSSTTVTSPQAEYFTGLEGNVYDEYGNKLGHNHSMKHGHTFSINTYHEHEISQKAHSHTLEPHSHDLEFGVYEDTMPSDITVKVNGVVVTNNINSNCEIDITKNIKLNSMNNIEIHSKTNGRIVANLWMSNFSLF